MSEPIYCTISIKVRDSWFPDWKTLQLRDVPGELDPMLDGWPELNVSPTDDGGLLLIFSGDGNYGLCDSDVENVLTWCETNHVPYVAHSDAKWDEFPAEHRVYLGEGEVLTEERSGESTVMDRATWEAIITGRHEWAKTIEQYFDGLPEADSLPIAHLPTDAPWSEDDDE